VTRIAKGLLLPTTITVEHAGLDRDEPIVVMSCFQHADNFTGETRRRYADLADTAAFVAALGVGMPGRPGPGVHGGRLDVDDPMAREWNVVTLGPRTATALVARDCGDTGPDRERRFDHAVTHDRALVVQAAEAILAAWATARADAPAG
jgi:DICT domain-containing protein